MKFCFTIILHIHAPKCLYITSSLCRTRTFPFYTKGCSTLRDENVRITYLWWEFPVKPIRRIKEDIVQNVSGLHRIPSLLRNTGAWYDQVPDDIRADWGQVRQQLSQYGPNIRWEKVSIMIVSIWRCGGDMRRYTLICLSNKERSNDGQLSHHSLYGHNGNHSEKGMLARILGISEHVAKVVSISMKSSRYRPMFSVML